MVAMKTIEFSRIRLSFITTLIILGVSVSAIASVRADGSVLRGFDVPALVPFGTINKPAPAIYWPIGVTFDGRNLWYSQPCDCTSDIFQSTTSGVLTNTLHELNQAGSLAWDGNHLWVGIFGRTCHNPNSGCVLLWQVDPVTGNVVKTLDLSAMFAADGLGGCDAISGLSYDSGKGTLWLNPNVGCSAAVNNGNPCDLGFVYNIDTSGNLLKRLQLPYGVAGVTRAGNNLYIVTCGATVGAPNRIVLKTTLDGTIVSQFTTTSISGQNERAESIVFDPVTFAPNCTLWVVQDYGIPFDASLAAYQVACN